MLLFSFQELEVSSFRRGSYNSVVVELTQAPPPPREDELRCQNEDWIAEVDAAARLHLGPHGRLAGAHTTPLIDPGTPPVRTPTPDEPAEPPPLRLERDPETGRPYRIIEIDDE
jgi:hypothetical protein